MGVDDQHGFFGNGTRGHVGSNAARGGRVRKGKFLPGICRGGGPHAVRWRGSSGIGRTPPPGFAWSPSPRNRGEELAYSVVSARFDLYFLLVWRSLISI
jgi:hypothetical protein